MTEASYQEKIDRLSVIAEILEEGTTELENVVALFEEGMVLVKSCEADLNAAQKRVMMLKETGETVPFDAENIGEENEND